MPLEGRDFSVKTTTNAEGKMQVNINGLTPIGEMFAAHCVKNLRAMIKEIK